MLRRDVVHHFRERLRGAGGVPNHRDDPVGAEAPAVAPHMLPLVVGPAGGGGALEFLGGTAVSPVLAA